MIIELEPSFWDKFLVNLAVSCCCSLFFSIYLTRGKTYPFPVVFSCVFSAVVIDQLKTRSTR